MQQGTGGLKGKRTDLKQLQAIHYSPLAHHILLMQSKNRYRRPEETFSLVVENMLLIRPQGTFSDMR